MRDLVTLGPWLRRFLPNTSSPSATWPGTPRRAIATPSACCCRLSAARCASRWTGWPLRDLTSARVLQFLAHLEKERRLLRPDPQSAARGHPGVRPLRRQPRSGPCRMVWSHPGHRVEEGHAAAGRMADQGGNGGHLGSPIARQSGVGANMRCCSSSTTPGRGSPRRPS